MMQQQELTWWQFPALRISQLDQAFIQGAVAERREAAYDRGEFYDWPDFIRDALIEAAQR